MSERDTKSPIPPQRLPRWLTKRLDMSHRWEHVRDMLQGLGLHTVCSGAHCPNQAECYARGTATFLILGERCTRSCRFCAIDHAAQLAPPDPDEPARVAEAAARLRLRHVVITSVTRDDLPDGGSAHFAAAIAAVRARLPQAVIEVLTPDFQGAEPAIDTVLAAHPHIFNHNVETVPRLYAPVRPQALYARSLGVLEHAKRHAPGVHTKSGLMVGLGERDDEILAVLRDLRGVGCDIVTIGQYLAPSPGHAPVIEFVPPERFGEYERQGRAMGFAAVAAGPFVRSSYHAEEVFRTAAGEAGTNAGECG